MKEPTKEKTYYALYDLKIEGFKAGMADENYEKVVRAAGQRIYDLSQSDEELAPKDATDLELMELYGYEVREVSKEQYDIIEASEEYGLTKKVTFSKGMDVQRSGENSKPL